LADQHNERHHPGRHHPERHGPRPGGLRRKLSHFLLDSDARFDNLLFQTERFAMVMDRFHVGGLRRWLLVEPFSEGATMAAGGLVLMLALAIPAFRET